MQSLVVIFAVCCLIVLAGGLPTRFQRSNEFRKSKIIGGTPAAEGEFPWHVSLQFFDSNETWIHVCDASIISTEFIITDQICIFKPEKDGRVVAGTVNWTNPGSIHSINETINNEIGFLSLMRVDPPFEFNSNIEPVRLPDLNEESLPGINSTVSGWDESAPFVPSDVLVKLNMPVVDKIKCYSSYPGVNLSNLICAGDSDNGTGMCSYNAVGAPLVYDGELRGLYYAQYPTCGNPGLYIEVSIFRDWIFQNTGV